MASKNRHKKKGQGASKKVIGLAVGLSAGIALFVAGMWFVDNRAGAFQSDGKIVIYPGTTTTELISQVQANLNPRFPRSIARMLKKEHADSHLFPGSYRFTPGNSAHYFARAVTRGWQNPVRVVITEGIHSKEVLCGRIASQLLLDSVSLHKAFNDRKLLSKYGTSPEQLFEFVIPDTYMMFWTYSPEEVISRLARERDKFWDVDRCKKAAAQGLTPGQVSILASIVAKETNRADEYPKIAKVYLRRLQKGMKLQACPTICYLYDYRITRVLYSHLRTDSPYNTYMYEGLPPTPICLPGKKHIDAVLNPDSAPYMYFCADPQLNGKNIFSATYEEHLKHSKAYHDALDSLGKSEK